MKEAGSIDVKMHQGMSCNECWARAGVIFFAREAKSRRVVTVFVLPPEKDPELMPPPPPSRPPPPQPFQYPKHEGISFVQGKAELEDLQTEAHSYTYPQI